MATTRLGLYGGPRAALSGADALNANDVESASEVSSPAVGQVHAILADDVESASELSTPAAGQEHTLLADDVQSTSEVSTPIATEGTNILLAEDVESASEVGIPTLAQAHVLLADDVESQSEVSQPLAAVNPVLISINTSGWGNPIDEARVIAGFPLNIFIDSGNESFVASGAAFDAIRQDIIDGITSAQSEAFGWNAQWQANEVVTAVTRSSNTQVTVNLTASPLYNITASETITVTIPASALVTSTTAVVATTTLGVTADIDEITDSPTAGFAARNYYDAYLQRKRRREKERKKVAAEIVQIEDTTDREIAKLMLSDRIHDERDEEISALEVLVQQQDVNRERIRLAETSEAVARAFTRAYMQGNFSALEAFEREMERAIEEEEFLLLALVLLE